LAKVLLIAAVSYLFGSIPFGYILVRIFRGEDVRQSGSGNIGATNVSRRSPALGVLTLALDALKGSIAVVCGALASMPLIDPAPPLRITFDLSLRGVAVGVTLAALCAVIGHMFPVWLEFRGGKGVATALGSFALIAPKAVLAAGGIFVVVVLASRYVSLGSIIAVAAFPVLAWGLHEYGNARAALLFMSLSALLIIGRHHQNIRRLLAGRERRLWSSQGAGPEPRSSPR